MLSNLENIFFDRDGIINDVVVRGSGSISSPRALNEFCIRPEFIDFYQRLGEKRNLNLFVISNQPDVARELMCESDLQAMNEVMENRFRFQEIVYCRHDDRHKCLCRKPKPGMIIYLLGKYGLRKERSVVIGDSEKDVQAGTAAGLKTILLATSYNRASLKNADFTVAELNEILAL